MWKRSRRVPITVLAGVTVVAVLGPLSDVAALAASKSGPANGQRNFDARVEVVRGVAARPQAAQLTEIDRLRRETPGVTGTFDDATGVTRTLFSTSGYLTPPRPGADAVDLSRAFVRDHRTALGLKRRDIASLAVANRVYNQTTGATHVYFQQELRGLPVYNGLLQVNVNRQGRIISVNNSFMPDLAVAANARRPFLSATDAVNRAATHLQERGPRPAPSKARLMLLPIRQGEARLVWNFQQPTADAQHHYDFTVDAATGQVWTRFDWVAAADYRVFPQPIESANHSPVPPPSDGRTIETNPEDLTASPYGWHDTDGVAGAEFTRTRGNNVHAYTDVDANNVPDPGSDPDGGGGLVFDFDYPIDFGIQAPGSYRDAAVTNLFYWNNIIHDIQYQYGFNEDLNFQVTQYGTGPGLGGDDVRAEAQDGSGLCNANFGTPPDGFRPRMQMFNCPIASPSRDGDFDNGVIVHEYAHGISNRTVGGPGNVSCLGNTQQPGEGWSDWLALAYTAEVGDADTDARGIASYLFGQPANGPGIRPAPYSTDFGVNSFTYSDIGSVSVPHGVGFVWATALWEAYWEVVNRRGFDPDLYDALAGAGNQRMMLYVQEGMANTVCGPTHLDARDGVIQAATDNFDGMDVCLLWDAFARRGYGFSATTAGPNSTSATDAFDIPAACTGARNVPDGDQAGYTTSGSLEQVVPVSPGDSCTLSMWVGKRSDGAGTWGRWYVQLTTGGWSIQNVLNGSLASQTDEWARYETTFTVRSFPNLPIKLRLKGQWGFETYDLVTLDCGGGDVVLNGSFESTVIPDGTWTTFGSPAPDDWTTIGGGAGLFNPNTTQLNDFF